ncbi:MAG: hypothetical protein IBX72_04655 [Nitrospirae bacterium]|jgi:hypothetical protein|nr:hypothetical protein [Nitrospirota bacterium]
MQRFKRFIGKQVISENLKDPERLITYGIGCKKLPESLDEFDEIELSVGSVDNEILLAVLVLEGKIKRIMFVKVNKSDPDASSPLTEEQLTRLLDEYGDRFINFFEYVTQ